jgi:hypothetical protein
MFLKRFAIHSETNAARRGKRLLTAAADKSTQQAGEQFAGESRALAMSSIGSATASQQLFSPQKMLQNELTSEVKAGTISSADQSALSSALDDIDKAMQSSKPSAGSRPSPDEMKSKINDLIAGEVSSGKLTSDQADELKNVFSNAFKGGPGGAGGPPPGAGGAGGAGGSKSSEDTDPADSNGDGTVSAIEQAAYDAANPASSDSASSSDSDVTKLLQNFLDSLKESQSKNSTYGGTGSSLASKLEALIVNYQA